jgi:hypothetical protein
MEQTERDSLDAWVGRAQLKIARPPLAVGASRGPVSGELTFVRRGAFLHFSGALEGIAMLWHGRLVLSFADAADASPTGGPSVGMRVEIGAYEVGANTVRGLWVPPGADQPDHSACGIEESTLKPGAHDTWQITRAVGIDGSEYAGQVHRRPTGPKIARGTPVAMHWQLADGDFRSFGLDFGDAVFATYCLEEGKPHGVAAFERKGETASWGGCALRSGESAAAEAWLTFAAK